MHFQKIKTTTRGEYRTGNPIYIASKESTMKLIDGYAVSPTQIKDTNELIKLVADSYRSEDRLMVVGTTEEVKYHVVACIETRTNIYVASEDKTYSVEGLKSKYEVELFKNQFIEPTADDIAFQAKLVADKVPFEMTREEAIQQLLSSNNKLKAETVTTAIDSAIDSLYERVRGYKKLSDDSVQTVKINKIEEAYKLISETEKAGETGIFIIKAPTGAGKNVVVTNPLITKSIAESKNSIHMSHRCSIASSEGLTSIKAMTHYNKVIPGTEEYLQSLNVVVNSIIRPNFASLFESPDLLVIDEAAQNLRHIINGSVDQRGQVFEKFVESIKNSKVAVLSDADSNPHLLDAVKLSGRTDITIIEMDINHKANTLTLHGYDEAVSQMFNSVAIGEKVIVSTDSADKAEGFALKIKKNHEDARVLVLTSRNIEGADQKAFIDNPNEESKKYDAVIYSPVITSNLSITNDYFDKTFGLFCGVLLPSDAMQMIRRNRCATEVIVGLVNGQKRDFQADDINVMKIRFAVGKMALEADYNNDENFDYKLADLEKEGFTDIAIKIATEEKFMKNHFISAFIANAKIDGFNVRIAEKDEEATQDGRGLVSASQKEATKHYQDNLLDATAGDYDLHVEVQSKSGESTEEEFYKLERARLEQTFCKSDIDLKDVKLWAKGALVSKIKNIELALMEDCYVAELDFEDSKKVSVDRNYPAIRKGIFDLFKTHIALDLVEGTADISTETSMALINAIIEVKHQFNLVSEIKATDMRKDSKQSVKKVKQLLLSFFNLKIKEKMVRVDGKSTRKYVILNTSFNEMNEIILRRQNAKGTHSEEDVVLLQVITQNKVNFRNHEPELVEVPQGFLQEIPADFPF